MEEKTKIFINKAIEIHGDKYDYTKSEYKSVDAKLEIICKKTGHGSFLQTPYKHLTRKQGCPICGIDKSKNKRIKPFSKSSNWNSWEKVRLFKIRIRLQRCFLKDNNYMYKTWRF
mgnify:CR=1 FL=1